MQLIRKLALGVATLSVALGAGHLVQSDSAPRADRVTASGLLAPAPGEAAATPKSIVPLAATAPAPRALRTSGEPPWALAVEKAAFTPPGAASLPADTAQLPPLLPPAALPPAALPPETSLAAVAADKQPPVALSAAATDEVCAPDLSVWPQTGAMLAVALILPCDPDAAVVLRHGGLALSARTGADGVLRISLPAMEDTGRVAVTLPDGEVLVQTSPLRLTGLRRVAVQWMDRDALALQVFEDGAAFGTPGHVSATQPRGAGEIVRLGRSDADLPMMSEVYTWPAEPVSVTVTVEAAVTPATCGREILGQFLDSRDGRVTATDLTLAMPDCKATGDVLVLTDLVADTTLAQAE